MRAIDCMHERELVEAIQSGRWSDYPDRCDQELRKHVQACAICADVAEVALALHDESVLAATQARVPSAGLVFWRAELRARQEAMRIVAKPIRVVQTLAAASAAGVAVGLLRWIDLTEVSDLWSQWATPISIALGAVLVLSPLALYFALSDE
jgi:hypothetical protein